MRVMAGLAVVAVLAMGGAAWASPPGITEKDGSFLSPDGKPLYTYRADAPGKAATGVGPAWPLVVK